MKYLAGVVVVYVAVIGMAFAVHGEDAVPLLKPEEFAVLPWGWTPGDAQVLETIRDCGFNLAGFVAPEHLDAGDPCR